MRKREFPFSSFLFSPGAEALIIHITLMNACNGIERPIAGEAMEITRLEPVIIEVEKDGKCLSHLILFEIKCNFVFDREELVVDGDIKETIFEMKEKNFY